MKRTQSDNPEEDDQPLPKASNSNPNSTFNTGGQPPPANANVTRRTSNTTTPVSILQSIPPQTPSQVPRTLIGSGQFVPTRPLTPITTAGLPNPGRQSPSPIIPQSSPSSIAPGNPTINPPATYPRPTTPTGKSSVTCFTCGQKGHYSPECSNTTPTTLTGKSSVTCFACGQKGHYSPECPNRKPASCDRCKQPGHYASQCTNQPSQTPRYAPQKPRQSPTISTPPLFPSGPVTPVSNLKPLSQNPAPVQSIATTNFTLQPTTPITTSTNLVQGAPLWAKYGQSNNVVDRFRRRLTCTTFTAANR